MEVGRSDFVWIAGASKELLREGSSERYRCRVLVKSVPRECEKQTSRLITNEKGHGEVENAFSFLGFGGEAR